MLGRWIKMQQGEFLANPSGRNETWTARGRNGTLLLGSGYGPRGAGTTEQAPSVAIPYVIPRMGDSASKLQDRAPHQRRRPFRFSWCSSLSSGRNAGVTPVDVSNAIDSDRLREIRELLDQLLCSIGRVI